MLRFHLNNHVPRPHSRKSMIGLAYRTSLLLILGFARLAHSLGVEMQRSARERKIAESLSKPTRGDAMRVPSEAKWGDHQADLDQDYAHKRFAGRTNQEMVPHFRRNVI